MIQIGMDCGTSLDTCHSHLCATGTSVGWPTVCHTLRPLSMGSALVHTPPPGKRRQWSLDWLDWRKQKTDVGKKKKLNTQGGWTLQESRVDFASLCTVVPWDLHSQNKNSKAKLLRSSRILPWRIYWFLVLRYSRGVTSGGLFWLAAWGCPLAAVSA